MRRAKQLKNQILDQGLTKRSIGLRSNFTSQTLHVSQGQETSPILLSLVISSSARGRVGLWTVRTARA
jgi:hypothetical protein